MRNDKTYDYLTEIQLFNNRVYNLTVTNVINLISFLVPKVLNKY